jgi:mRNA degradation ribonuclease J1/J2
MTDIPKTVESLISELQSTQLHESEAVSLYEGMLVQVDDLRKQLLSEQDKLKQMEETNLNNVANYQLQVKELKERIEANSDRFDIFIKENAELSAAVVKMREALKANGVFHTPMALRKNGHDWDEYQIDAINRTREALSLAPRDALKEYLKETINILHRSKLSLDEFHYKGLYEDIQKELSRLTGGGE